MEPFVFVICQHGAEVPLKQQATASGDWRLAFSRPGLLTLKYVGAEPVPPSIVSPLVRLSGTGLGTARGEQALESLERVWQLASRAQQGGQPLAWAGVHIFERDQNLPGSRGFEPGSSELASAIAGEFSQWLADRGVPVPVNQPVPAGGWVLDVIVSEPTQWLVGYHQVRTTHEQWPGGVPAIAAPSEMVSRAYLKIAEALQWSQLPIRQGDRIVEIGSAPGGACQRLLDLGYQVTGIDAAEMDERIAGHPRFEHWRSKAAAVKRKQYRKFRWLVCDANVAPNYTLDVVGDIVNYEGNAIEGMLLTFKLSAWEQLAQLADQLAVIRSWGYPRVEARQLAHNRRELCVVAQRLPGRPAKADEPAKQAKSDEQA